MHRSNEQGDAVSITQKIKLQTWDLTETNCPAIKEEVEKLEELHPKLPKLTADTIVLHPMNHEFHIQAPLGDMSFVLWDEEEPLVKWAPETRRVSINCATAK